MLWFMGSDKFLVSKFPRMSNKPNNSPFQGYCVNDNNGQLYESIVFCKGISV